MVLACSPKKKETFGEKFVRKCSAQPLVPMGGVLTVAFLVSGLKSFNDGNSARSQKMMRGRVLAQGVTVCFIVAYAYYDQVIREKAAETDEERDQRVLTGATKKKS